MLREDIESFHLPADLTETLRGKTIIVTGATGLVGSAFVRCVAGRDVGVKWLLPVRDMHKAIRMFEDTVADIDFAETSDLAGYFHNLRERADYIVHCASPTNGKYMSSHPVETYTFTIESTREILEYARRESVGGVVLLSSIEYYGQINDQDPVTEERAGHIDMRSPRSSYALGKQAAEYLGFCYANEYGVPVKTARLTQTFGAGLPKTDNRVFAQFARSVIEGRDIVLHTEGLSAKPYCYTVDCVEALIFILLRGLPGEAYNVATPGTYITIRDLARLYAQKFSDGSRVIFETLPDAGYAPDTTVNLSADKLFALGWQPRYGLEEMLRRLIEYMRETQYND